MKRKETGNVLPALPLYFVFVLGFNWAIFKGQ